MLKSLTQIAAEIASAQARSRAMSPNEMSEFLNKTFGALKEIRGAEEGRGTLAVSASEIQPLDPMASIQRNKVICLECGKAFKTLTNNHLGKHGLNAREYRKKYDPELASPPVNISEITS